MVWHCGTAMGRRKGGRVPGPSEVGEELVLQCGVEEEVDPCAGGMMDNVKAGVMP